MKPHAFAMKGRAVDLVIGSMLALAPLPTALAETILYGGLGGHGISSGPQASTNDGALVTVSQLGGGTTLVGHPAGVARISGLAFGLDGALFGATQVGGGFPPPPGPVSTSNLIRIDPDTGALVSSVPIVDGATPLSIADLAVHPTTGVLFGTGGVGGDKRNGSGRVYTIDTTTGAATFIGDTGRFFASIAFAPDGTLYMAAAQLDSTGVTVQPALLTLHPANAAVVTSIPTAQFYGALAVRPTDGVIFGGNADQQGVFTINPANGTATLLGLTGQNFVGDFAFRSESAPPAALDLNQHGLSGSWYEPATSGQGVEVEVFPNLSGPGAGVVQVSWFTYDSALGGAERQRWYTLGGSVATGAASASLAIYQNVGGNFNALPITMANQVGSATLRFTACDQGELDYAFSDGTGRTGTIPLARLTRNVTCSTTAARPVNADFAFSGNWFDPATSGQGITVEINPLSPVAFFAWYTYAPSGAAAGAAAQRWYTGQSSYAAGARTLPMTLYETTGGRFDAPTTPPPHTAAVGTATLAFQSCAAATLTFNFNGGSSAGATGTIALVRVGPVPPGCAI